MAQMRTAFFFLLALACARAQIPTENSWGETTENSEILTIAASAQASLAGQAGYNFSRTISGPGTELVADAGEMGKLTVLPGPPGISLTYALLEIGPCAMIVPHSHSSGNEIEYTLVGDKLKAGLVPNGAFKMEVRDIPPGTLSIYPEGLMHVQFNTGCERAKLFVHFDKPAPTGVITVSENVVTLPSWMAAVSLNAYGANLTAADIDAMQASVAKTEKGLLAFVKLPADQCEVCK